MKNKKYNRSQKKTERSLIARSNIASWTMIEFSNSFKAVKNNFFHIRIEKPKNEIEKVLFVSIEDLKYALENIKLENKNDDNQVLKFDEYEINNAYEQIVK
jgi:hypothetical protein